MRGRDAFARVLEAGRLTDDALLAPLADETPAADADLPETGVGRDLERVLSPLFIRGTRYGTRASTAMLLGPDGGGHVTEQTWGPDGVPGPLTSLALSPPL